MDGRQTHYFKFLRQTTIPMDLARGTTDPTYWGQTDRDLTACTNIIDFHFHRAFQMRPVVDIYHVENHSCTSVQTVEQEYQLQIIHRTSSTCPTACKISPRCQVQQSEITNITSKQAQVIDFILISFN